MNINLLRKRIIGFESKELLTLLVDGGYVSFTKTGSGVNATYTPEYHFYMKDHLGSNRVVASAAGVAEQVNHYYPYGSTFYGETTADHRYKYCDKELDKMHGLDWYDSSARYYDHVLGRFHQMDPLAGQYYPWSPYAYCHSNPMNRIDPTGKDGVLIIDKDRHNITVKANYYVETGSRPSKFVSDVSGYSNKDILRMQRYNDDLNKLGFTITEGDFSGYTISFDLKFIAGGNMMETMNASSEDYYEGYHIGNTIARWDETFRGFSPRETATGERVEIGGVTSENKDIIMNINHDTKMNRLHEIFHTFGFVDFNEGERGYGIMNYPPCQPNKEDANSLISNHFLPIIYE